MSERAKFTPGPWQFNKKFGWVQDCGEPCHRRIAIVDDGAGISSDEADANGLLMASATDLYAACKALVARDEEARSGLPGRSGSTYAIDPTVPHAVIEQARAALRKAEGGQS